MAQEKFVNESVGFSGHTEPKILHGRVECVNIYEVKDNELDVLEKGSPAEIQLNFAIFLFSLAFSSIISLSTATFTDQTFFIIYIVVSVVGLLGGAYLLLIWYKSHQSISRVIKTIRNRIPSEPPYQSKTDTSKPEESPKDYPGDF
jgi:hypothetical protein